METYILKRDILVIALFAMFLATVNSKLTPFIIFFLSLIIFKFIWQHQVPVNEIYMFPVSHLKIVMAALAYFETHTLLMIITNVNLITQL